MRTKKTLTVKQIAQALDSTGGFITQAAVNLGRTPRTIHRRIAQSQFLQDVVWDISERYTDLAESEHIQELKDRKAEHHYDAVKFHLRTKGKHRGYVERTEQEQFIRVDHLNEVIAAIKAGPVERVEYAKGDSGDIP